MKKIPVGVIIIVIVSSFLLSNPVIEYNVTKPDSDSKWAKGSERTIIWDKKGDKYPKVKIRLFTSPGNLKVFNIASDVANEGSYLWKIPKTGLNNGKYYIRVKTDNNLNWGESPVFDIIGETLHVGIIKEVRNFNIEMTSPPPKVFLKPVIKSAWSDPFGSLRPGVRLYLKGERFGDKKGRIFLIGNFPGEKVELTDVNWVSSSKVNGVVPDSANGQPNQSVQVVAQTKHKASSEKWGNLAFEGREEKILLMKDIKVTCGKNTWCNICNTTSSGCGSKPFTTGKSDLTVSISGYHKNNILDPSPDSGFDHYHINLKNGWVIKNYKNLGWKKSYSADYLETLHLHDPIGKAVWDPKIHWRVSKGEYVSYKLRIYVEGPIGTSYK